MLLCCLLVTTPIAIPLTLGCAALTIAFGEKANEYKTKKEKIEREINNATTPKVELEEKSSQVHATLEKLSERDKKSITSDELVKFAHQNKESINITKAPTKNTPLKTSKK